MIPVYNERHTLKTLVDKVRAVPIRKQIILIDDCSKDGTTDLLVSTVIRTHEPQVWFLAEHMASTRLLPEESKEQGNQPPVR